MNAAGGAGAAAGGGAGAAAGGGAGTAAGGGAGTAAGGGAGTAAGGGAGTATGGGAGTATGGGLSHVDETGAARMVDVSAKDVTARTARATGQVLLGAAAVRALRAGAVPKGDALAVARIAGIAGAKRTPDLVPLCHPIALHGVTVDLGVEDWGVSIAATARTADRTGVEMEALTAVSVAALALFDMVKAIDPAAVICDIQVEEKTGGSTGPWRRPRGACRCGRVR